jgi:hypothetical protein
LTDHTIRAHSKFSASGAERWFNCPGSVELSEGLPDKSSVWAVEGTYGHEVLETLLLKAIKHDWQGVPVIAANIEVAKLLQNPEMPSVASKLQRNFKDMVNDIVRHSRNAADFMLKKFRENPDAEFMVETRIYLSFIHEAMFGTFDGAVVDHFGTLHVFDYKYGAGHAVSPGPLRSGGDGNLQMIFYAIGLAFRYHWNFKRVRMWIIQPRIKGYDGPMFWEISIMELKQYVSKFERAVERVERFPEKFVEGSWCHWCKAKSICPLKREAKLGKAKQLFSFLPVEKDSEFL